MEVSCTDWMYWSINWHEACLSISGNQLYRLSERIYKLTWSLNLNEKERSVENMAKIILASHGGLSKGMKDSVSMIVGDLAKDIET